MKNSPSDNQDPNNKGGFGEGAGKKYTNDRKNRFLAVLFGILPDLASFAPAFLYMLFSGTRFGPQSFGSELWIFKYAMQSYNFTHSFIIFLIVMVIVMALRKGRTYWPMWGWALHIVIDIFTHKNFFSTPFLFPLSNYNFTHGISWAHPSFMIVNYSLLALCYLIWFLVLRKK